MTIQTLPADTVHAALADTVIGRIEAELRTTRPGQCMRISALPEAVMQRVCAHFADTAQADVVMLIGPQQTAMQSWQISATKLIELRNAEAKPLLAFVPPGLKVPAEDSFDVSTFGEIDLGDAPRTLAEIYLRHLSDDLRPQVQRIVLFLRREHNLSIDEAVRFYATIEANGKTSEATGGALYQLRLLPDFALLSIPNQIEERLDRNISAIRTLADSGRPLIGRIHDLKLQLNTIQGSLFTFLRSKLVSDIVGWSALIATDPANQALSFDRWVFAGEARDVTRVRVYIHDLNLPLRERQQPPGPDNPLYLDIRKATSVVMSWETNPRPALVPDLDHFRIQIVDNEGAQIWEGAKIATGSSTRAARKKTIKVQDFKDRVEDGLYFFRVRAYTVGGDVISEEDSEAHPEILRDPQNPLGKRTYESDDVWFWVDSQGSPPPVEPQRNITVPSFLSARLHALFTAIDRGDNVRHSPPQLQRERTTWAAVRGRGAEATYNIVYDAQARYTLPISSILKIIETRTLAEPETLGRWRLMAIERLDVDPATLTQRLSRSFAQIPEAFKQARMALFRAISDDAGGIVETTDLLGYKTLISAYAQAYAVWLAYVQAHFDDVAIQEEGGRRRTESLFLDLDTVELIIPNGDGEPDRVYLLGPTHPLRLLWHLQHAQVAQSWIDTALDRGNPRIVLSEVIRDFLCAGPPPANLPPVIRIAHEASTNGTQRFYIEQSPLTPFWSLYIRADSRDTRALRERVLQVLNIGRKSIVTETNGPTAADMVRKILRYLGQHPYVRTLKINCFNPGDAGLIVDSILLLEKQVANQRNGANSLRYELRLFSRSHPDAAGTALVELLNPAQQVSAEADAFTVAGTNHLFPKLRFSRNTVEDFLEASEQFEAHISVMHDMFPVSAGVAPRLPGRSSFVYSLVQEHVTRFAGETYAWQRQVVPSAAQSSIDDIQRVSTEIANIMRYIGELQAAISTGKSGNDLLPTIQLALEARDKNLLYQIHAVSDWVLIIDRHLGLEYFDSEGDDRTIYMLDFTPEFATTDVERLLLTTRAVDEVTRLIQPPLTERNLRPDPAADLLFLQLIRSLSGRLALKLLAAPTSVGETLGLAMARLLLDQYQLLTDQILIPLDAHVGLFGVMDSMDGETTLQRGDLLLVACDEITRELTFRVIEVKWRTNLGDIAAYHGLRQEIEQQIQSSIVALQHHFGPQTATQDRLDRQLKVRELVGLLLFYLDRSRRYGLVSPEASERIQRFIETLDQGYRLDCRGVGLIFDLGSQGLNVDEEHAGLVFHRVGHDYMLRLIVNGLERRAKLRTVIEQPPATIEDATVQVEQERSITDDTSMRRDSTFQRVRTAFGAVTPPSETNSNIHVVVPGHPSDHILPIEEGQQTASSPTLAEGSASEREQQIQVDPPAEIVRVDIDVAHEKTHSESSGQVSRGLEPASIEPSARPESKRPAIVEVDTSNEPSQPHELPPPYDILIGDTGPSRQYGLLGRALGQTLALDLNSTNTIALFGVQGGGKSYTVGSIVEMATQSFTGINQLPGPLASVIFHYHESQDYAPEFVSMIAPNDKEDELAILAQEYGAQPGRLEDVLILTSADKVAERRAEFPSIEVAPIAFSSRELSVRDWRFLMGVFGDQMYMKQVNLIMRQVRGNMSLETLRRELEASELTENQKRVVRNRLAFAAQFIDDSRQLADTLRPGRLIVVDLRDELIEKEEALGLFVVMLNIFAGAGRTEGFNKLIVFDEAHKYMDNRDLTSYIVDVIRQMRHQGVSIVIASQDPPSLPNEIIELSSIVVMHRFNSPQWLKHVQRSITALADLTSAEMSNLRPGEAFLWANKTNQPLFTSKAVKVRFRPRVTRHGGGTKTAV